MKEVRLPTAPAEKAVTVLITEAAALEPGKFGSVMVLDNPPEGILGPDLPVVGVEVLRIVGSARYHQPGMKTGPVPNVRRVR